MQETEVWSPIWEDPAYHGATKPMLHNYWACTLKPVLCNKKSHQKDNLLTATMVPPTPATKEKPMQQRRPSTAKNK